MGCFNDDYHQDDASSDSWRYQLVVKKAFATWKIIQLHGPCMAMCKFLQSYAKLQSLTQLSRWYIQENMM